MTDHGILFSAAMVGAQIEGRKTQTRRVVAPANCTVNGYRVRAANPAWKGLLFDHPECQLRTQSTIMQAIAGADAHFDLHLDVPFLHPDDAARGRKWEDDECFYRVRPIVERGDRLWVREAFMYAGGGDPGLLLYRATWRDDAKTHGCDNIPAEEPKGWTPGIHMKRAISRLTWLVTNVRFQRLHEIDELDAPAEGALRMVMDDEGKFYQIDSGTYRCGFAGVWAHINGASSWEANPWVVAYTGTVERRNIDA